MIVQSDERRQRAMRVIKGLLEKKLERGATPSEAGAAIAKVQELLCRYQITMMDVETQEIKDNMGRADYDTNRKNSNPGEVSLASAVAIGYDCKLVIDRNGPCIKYVFLGYNSDVEISEYTFTYLLRTLTAWANNQGRDSGFYKQKLVRYRNNYLIGAAGTIRKRMIDSKKQQQIASAATSLTLVKKPKVNEYVGTQYKNLKYNGQKTNVKYNPSAMDAGRKAGSEIALRKAVETERLKAIN